MKNLSDLHLNRALNFFIIIEEVCMMDRIFFKNLGILSLAVLSLSSCKVQVSSNKLIVDDGQGVREGDPTLESEDDLLYDLLDIDNPGNELEAWTKLIALNGRSQSCGSSWCLATEVTNSFSNTSCQGGHVTTYSALPSMSQMEVGTVKIKVYFANFLEENNVQLSLSAASTNAVARAVFFSDHAVLRNGGPNPDVLEVSLRKPIKEGSTRTIRIVFTGTHQRFYLDQEFLGELKNKALPNTAGFVHLSLIDQPIRPEGSDCISRSSGISLQKIKASSSMFEPKN